MVTVNIDKGFEDLKKLKVNLKDGSITFDLEELLNSTDTKFIMLQLSMLHSIRLNLLKIGGKIVEDTLKYVDGLILLAEYKFKISTKTGD